MRGMQPILVKGAIKFLSISKLEIVNISLGEEGGRELRNSFHNVVQFFLLMAPEVIDGDGASWCLV